ncbi:hypothetical protein ABT369_39350 [Dactylosporangium sp. NPDC000244]|uniref:hypothetical protein n=1 Tax=Dactylosporangium sp. NPDC000244 TaxID=3154365 RepID=UPI003321845D
MSGVEVTVRLTRRQAEALLRGELSVGHGVRRSADLVAAEERLKAAVGQALNEPPARLQTEPGA